VLRVMGRTWRRHIGIIGLAEKFVTECFTEVRYYFAVFAGAIHGGL
jgi:hypothetical protein